MFSSSLILATSALAFVPVTSALREQVISSFVFTRYGDRTPLYSSDISELTPYGAQQMYNAGSKFRNRYLMSTFGDSLESTAIRDISRYQLNADEVSVMTTDYQYTVASAQAFMQGLYPPLADVAGSNYTTLLGVSGLANGTNVVAPLHGYQYPQIKAVSSYDLRSVYLDGAQNCPAYTDALIEYYNSSDFDFLYKSTIEFYGGLEDGFLEGTFVPNELGYFDAYYIYDYMQYQYLHNSTFRNSISSVNMTKAKTLAADWVYAMFSNGTDPLKSIAGRSLATQIVASFYDAIQTQGRSNKLTLWFGDYAPMVSFAALAHLTSEQNAIFYDVPAFGSSFIFELVSLLPETDSGASFPNTTDLYVQFYYQNGTDEYAQPVAYPLFGGSPSQTLISYSDFLNGLSESSLSGVKEWCETCQSYSIFCPAYTDGNSLLANPKRGLSPAVSGVIGAVVALAVAAVLFGLAMLVGGLRVHRREGKRKSPLGGFKGSQKLASDQDLTIPKGGAGATVVTTEPDAVKGHERVGSWELRQAMQKKEAGEAGASTVFPPRRPSFEDDDPHAPVVKPHEQV